VLVLVLLAKDLDPSVFLSGGWFLLALLFHRFVIAPRTRSVASESAEAVATEVATTPQ
jgi:hypothetical protein